MPEWQAWTKWIYNPRMKGTCLVGQFSFSKGYSWYPFDCLYLLFPFASQGLIYYFTLVSSSLLFLFPGYFFTNFAQLITAYLQQNRLWQNHSTYHFWVWKSSTDNNKETNKQNWLLQSFLPVSTKTRGSIEYKDQHALDRALPPPGFKCHRLHHMQMGLYKRLKYERLCALRGNKAEIDTHYNWRIYTAHIPYFLCSVLMLKMVQELSYMRLLKPKLFPFSNPLVMTSHPSGPKKTVKIHKHVWALEDHSDGWTHST